MSTAMVVYQKPEEVRAEFTALSPQMAEVLPAGVDAQRFMKVAVKAILGNPKLMQCTRASLLSSVMAAAELGLEPSGLLGSAYLVPYRNRRQVDGQWQTVSEAQLIPGYRGLIDLARRSGEILKIEARVVRMRDTFSIDYGRPVPIMHVPFIADPTADAEDRDPGPYVGAYMTAMLKGDPVPQTEWMSTDEIEAVRKRSKAADDGPWVTDWSEMARKTVVRRGSKYLPLTTDFRRALELDEEAERGAIEPVPTVAVLTPAQRLLAQRMEARLAQPDGPGAEVGPETATATTGDASAGPGPAGVPTANHAHSWRDPLPAMIEDGDYSQVCTECGDTREAIPGRVVDPATGEMSEPSLEPTLVVSATAICGDDGGLLGVCTRAPGHPAGHRSEKGAWPKARK